MKVEIPKGWEKSTIGEAFITILGQSPPSSTYNKKEIGLPFFQGKAEFGERYPTIAKWCSSPKKIAEYGDILLSVRAPVGPTNLAPSQCCIGRGLAAIRPICSVDSRFVLYMFRHFENKISGVGTGTTFKAITGSQLNGFPIILPPLPEQNRIVSKIEELLTRLDAGIEALKQVETLLKRYRQSVLKSAVEGKLTSKWHEQHKDELEPADKLLERILKERKEKWEAEQLANFKAKGKTPPNNWQEKYKEPTPPDTSKLPELPDGWVWSSLDQLIDILTDYHANGSYKVLKSNVTIKKEHDYAKMIRSLNLVKDDFVDDLRYISKHAYEFLKKSKLYGEEILIGKIGNAGKVYIMPKLNEPASLGMNLFLIRINDKFLNKYVYYHLKSIYSKIEINDRVKGVGNPTIDKKSIRGLSIALPPMEEQRYIVKMIDYHLSIADEIDEIIESELKRSQSLHHSILKRAFEGKLVPQDPHDEPASVLLERIKAEKSNPKKAKQMEIL